MYLNHIDLPFYYFDRSVVSSSISNLLNNRNTEDTITHNGISLSDYKMYASQKANGPKTELIVSEVYIELGHLTYSDYIKMILNSNIAESGDVQSNNNENTDANSTENSHANTSQDFNMSSNENDNTENIGNLDSSSNGNNSAANTNPCANGHRWTEATCTTSPKCSVCGKTSGKALGHDVYVTKCKRCNYSDFSKIAKSYADKDIVAYDGATGESYNVTNVRISSSGILSFTFNGKSYSVKWVQTDKQISTTNLVAFDCYVNGVKEPNALGMYNPQYGFPSFEWKHLDGHYLYFYAQ